MRPLSLRSRLLVGVGLVAIVQALAAVVLISIASDQLLDQIDERLTAAVGAGSGIDDVYQAVLSSDGSLVTVNAVTIRDDVVPAPPSVDPALLSAALGGPITVEAQAGDLEYRLLAVGAGGNDTLILASPLRSYEWTINRLSRLVMITAAAMILVLVAVTWWVLRLGIRPIKQMTVTAQSIAAGDLSERIDEADPSTEAGQLAAALNTMMGRIETSFEEQVRTERRLRQFVADASHELRTPVATIRGYAELYLAGGLEDPAERDDAMRRTHLESQRMSRLIGDMLALAKLDREPEVRHDHVDLGALARDVAVDSTASHDELTLDVVAGPEPVVVSGDEDLLRQALGNLVSNAAVHAGPNATTTLTVIATGAHARVEVRDDGAGMSAYAVSRATERFYRADPSRSRARGGSGLGLAIVADIVAAHDGDLSIESTPDVGTIVSIEIPLAVGLEDSQPAPS